MHSVVALALPSVVAFDLAIPAQVFGHPDEQHLYTFTTAALKRGAVPTTTGFEVLAGHGLEALEHASTIIVPGYEPHDPPGQPVLQALRGAAARGTRIASVCTGAFALSAAGLLDGRRATTHWRNAAELAARYPAVKVDPDVLYVDEGSTLTSAGVAAGIDLCLHLVRHDHGAEAAGRIARRMVVAPYREGGQAQYIERPVPQIGAGLASTCTWALDHLDEPLTVTMLAEHAGWAPRTFARRFVAETGTTPLRWLTSQRLLLARKLLESTNLSIEQVATRSGLNTSANLRLHLRRDVASTPSAYRRTHGTMMLASPQTLEPPVHP